MRNYDDSTTSELEINTYYTDGNLKSGPTIQSYTNLNTLERSDVVKRSAGGFRQPTPYLATSYRQAPPIGTFTSKYRPLQTWRGPQDVVWNGYIAANSGGFITNGFRYHFDTKDLALLRAYSRLNDSKLNLAITLAEFRSTWSMISDRAIRIYRFAKALKRGRLKEAARHVGLSPKGFKNYASDASSAYLEFQFGWMQLLSDVQNGISELERYEHGPLPRLTGRAVIKHPRSASDVVYDNAYTWKPGFKIERSSEGYDLSLVRLDYEIGDWNAVTLNRLGLINPLEVAWDLVPYSFVFDWFIPVGSWISSFTADAGLRFLGGSRTDYTYRLSTNKIYPYSQQSDITCEGSCSDHVEEYKYMKRTTFGSPPIVFLPPSNLSGSLGQALTAVALVVQRSFNRR